VALSVRGFALVLASSAAALFALDRAAGIDESLYDGVLFLFVLLASSAYVFLGAGARHG
jgi:hypothetical protein